MDSLYSHRLKATRNPVFLQRNDTSLVDIEAFEADLIPHVLSPQECGPRHLIRLANESAAIKDGNNQPKTLQ
jgi:hypothetical protein